MKTSKRAKRFAKLYNQMIGGHELRNKVCLINVKKEDITYTFLRKKLFELYEVLEDAALFEEEQHCYAVQEEQIENLAPIALAVSLITALYSLSKDWHGTNTVIGLFVLLVIVIGIIVLYIWTAYSERTGTKKSFNALKMRCMQEYKERSGRSTLIFEATDKEAAPSIKG